MSDGLYCGREINITGHIRSSELCNLSVYDLDRNQGTVMVRQGKGGKDMLIPMGDRALAWIDKYITHIRPDLVTEPDAGFLFLNNQGHKLAPDYLTNLIGHYVKQANINKQGACHLFRHTMAMVMHENGADIRFIQQMLGHADLSTTQIYTHVSIKKLKQIHSLTHPARLPVDE